MTFWGIFFRLLPHRPRQALAALYWHLTRRKVRARNRLRRGTADLPFAYRIWIESIEEKPPVRSDCEGLTRTWSSQPSFSVLLLSQDDHAKGDSCRSRASLERQIYPAWTLTDVDAGNLFGAMSAADSDYVLPLLAGDELSETALFRLAEALRSADTALIAYGDDDELGRRGERTRPWFKPSWNEEMFLAQNLLTGAVAIEAGFLREIVGRFSPTDPLDLDRLLLAATSMANGRILHVPHILAHVDRRKRSETSRMDAVDHHVRQWGGFCTDGPFGTLKVLWPLPDPRPMVSIIIPTRDRLDLLRPCVESVLARTTYDPFEVLIVDNGSISPDTTAYLADVSRRSGVSVLSYDAPYNYSAINNFAVRAAKGKYLCLLNNDTQVVEPEWLTEMMRQAVRPTVGAVGAKLLYEDGTIQHAGVVVGICEAAGHAHRFERGDAPGYFCRPHVAHFVTAVTAACLVVDREKYEAVGGLDEEHLEVAYNDVDLCLKLQSAGWWNVYVPHAVLLHHESKSRGNDMAPQHVERYLRELRVLQDRWQTKTYEDPLHSPNLDRYSESYVVRI